MLARRTMKSNDLAAEIGITPQNLSILKTGKARTVRLEILDRICRCLDCQPGNILEYTNHEGDKDHENDRLPYRSSSDPGTVWSQ